MGMSRSSARNLASSSGPAGSMVKLDVVKLFSMVGLQPLAPAELAAKAGGLDTAGFLTECLAATQIEFGAIANRDDLHRPKLAKSPAIIVVRRRPQLLFDFPGHAVQRLIFEKE